MRTQPPVMLRIASHNIRYAATARFEGERPWEERRRLVLNQHHFTSRLNPETFLCLQEVLHRQLEDLASGLNVGDERWDYIGVGRNDGKTQGEYAPIFYRPDVWNLEHWTTVWLSETPDVPSKGWDASSIRIVTIGVFQHKDSHQTVLAMNTHLDDQGSTARYESAKLILYQIDYYLRKSEYGEYISGVFLAGDFNSEEQEEAYTVLTGNHSPLVDAAKQVAPILHYGNYDTYTGFGNEHAPQRIDHILIGPRDHSRLPWHVRGYSVLPNKFDDGVANSDHRVIVADAHLH